MKNLINYLYNIDINNINIIDNNYILETFNNQKYLLYEVVDKERLQIVISISNYLKSAFNLSYYLIKNIYNDYTLVYENRTYVLLKISENFQKNVEFIDMTDFYNKSSNYIRNANTYQNNWRKLWESKIDYLIYHENNNSNKNDIDRVLFFYYIGLAETALIYINDLQNMKYLDSKKITITHRRINYQNNELNFYNPFSYIIDFEQRDIAEYIKLQFYKHQDYLTDLEYYFKTNKLSMYDASILYARIIYPSFYFDYYENENTSSIKKDDFLKTKDLEKFLLNTYILINKYVPIKKVEWL